MFREAFQDLARLRTISGALVRHGFGAALQRSAIPEADRLAKEAVPVVDPGLNARIRFRMLLAELGPTFVKLGQTLSTRPDLLPAALCEELAVLQDQVTPLPVDVVHRVIEDGLGKPISELFRSIEPQPLASASIAQAHLATTFDGEEVVVKVQRPGIADTVRADLDLLRYLAIAAEALFEEAGIYAPRGIVDEFDRTLHEELDFGHEADNLRAFAATHAQRPTVKIPRLFETLSCRTVLTMERLHGVKVTEADFAIHDRQLVGKVLVEEAFGELFTDGLFHGDPHPGNVFVLHRTEGQVGEVIGLIDFGVVGRMTRAMQENLVTLVMAVALKDADSAARVLYKVGVPDQRANLSAFRDDIADILDRYLRDARLDQINATSLARDLLDLAVRYRIRIPKEYAVLARSAVLLEGIARKVTPDLDILEAAGPHARHLLSDRLSPGDLQGNLFKMGLRMQTFATEVPLQLSQILLDLEGGKLSVRVKSDDLQQVTLQMRQLGVTVFCGVMASALVLGSFQALIASGRIADHLHWLALFGVATALGLSGVASGWFFFAGRVGKIRLSRWFRR